MEELKTEITPVPCTSKWATWSMGLGITGLILCFIYIPSLLAIIFGIIALVKIDESKGLIIGKGRALAGIIMGGTAFAMIPFVAIVAAIVIPNLLTSRISANEASAEAGLKLMCNAEALWYQQDADGNGEKDYWTHDVSCFYRALRTDNATKIAFIPIDLARADAKPARPGIFGNTSFRLADLPEPTSIPKSGYLFQVMESDENGEPYNQAMVNNVPATNKTKFAFVAYPDVYGSSGVRTFIINQDGTIYCTDCGSDANKIVLQWPGINPCDITGPGGRQWMAGD